MTWISNIFVKTFFTLAIAGYLVAGNNSILTSVMNMTEDYGVMVPMQHLPCPFMSDMGMCSMTPLQHAIEWQQQSQTLLQSTLFFAILLLSFIVIRYVLVRLSYQYDRALMHFLLYRYREKSFDSILRALARGIIHSKAY